MTGYLKLDDEMISRIEKETIIDYERKGNFIPIENIKPMLEDLLIIIDELREKNEEEYAPDYDEIGKDIRMGTYEYELGGKLNE